MALALLSATLFDGQMRPGCEGSTGFARVNAKAPTEPWLGETEQRTRQQIRSGQTHHKWIHPHLLESQGGEHFHDFRARVSGGADAFLMVPHDPADAFPRPALEQRESHPAMERA